MKKKKLIITIILSVFITLAVIFAVLLGIKIYQDKLVESGYSETPNSANQYAKDVTIVQLIATPEKYDGQLVRVIGVGNLELEANYISLSKEDSKYSVGNSIWIDLDKKTISYEESQRYNGEYVIIEGVFDKDDCGHMDMFCGSIKNIRRYDLWDSYLVAHSTITQHANDKTYSYEITDYKGKILDYEYSLTREPKRQKVSIDIVGISIQAGTGLSTNYAKYYDLENSKISETFYYVLTAKDGLVIYADYRDGEHYIVVQDIFDKEQYYQEYTLENVSPVAADFVVDGYFNTKGNVNITYLSGEDYTETNYTIVITPKANAESANDTLPYEYATIINNIIYAYPWNDDDMNMVPENPELSYMYRRNSELSEVGFVLIDLDGNGQEELIISDPSKFVYDVYTISNGKAVHLFDSGERYYYILRENGIVENSWSGSAATSGHDFYKLNDGKLVFIERITLDAYHALDAGLIDDLSEATDDNCFFISDSKDEKDYKSVTSEEAINAIENYQNANKELEIEYTFLSDYKK